MRHLRVTNIQRGCVYDGPGVRTTVFLKGCSLKCPWCCNPESISFDKDWFVDYSKCLKSRNVVSKICEHCERNNGNLAITECPFGVLEPTSFDYSFDKLFKLILHDENLYRKSKGGVTISGGEPLLQADGLIPLFKQLREEKIDIAIETTLIVPTSNLKKICTLVDLFIVDIKLQPQMMLNDTSYIKRMHDHLEIIKNKNSIFRMVFVNEVWPRRKMVLESLKRLGISNMEILACHNLGEKKYQKLLMSSIDYSSDKNLAKEFVLYLSSNGIKTTFLSV